MVLGDIYHTGRQRPASADAKHARTVLQHESQAYALHWFDALRYFGASKPVAVVKQAQSSIRLARYSA
jgi:hypothetical protein